MKFAFRLCVWSLSLFASVTAFCVGNAVAAPAGEEIVLREGVYVPPVGRYGRGPTHTDAVEALIVAGKWTSPKAGETITLPDGRTQTWTALTADKDGVFHAQNLGGGYLDVTLNMPSDRVMLLEASADNMVYVNGEPRTGDIYQTGWALLPVLLHAGRNELLFHCANRGPGGGLKARLVAPSSAAMLNLRDTTLPDLVRGEKEKTPLVGGVIVINSTAEPLTDLTLRAFRKDAKSLTTDLPALPPLSTRKVLFHLDGSSPTGAETTDLNLELTRKFSRRTLLDTGKVGLRVRQPNQTRKITFVSGIDGSVQYYGLNPMQPGGSGTPALFLSLHGAGVEAIGQADAYSPKSWGHLVAPTNRRPFGFDWEDWGRWDAMEVLGLAQERLHPDPQRIYLTGHSMGGHGTWHLGATFPDRFAAIGPSAGWISLFSYAGAVKTANPTPMQEMLLRPMLPSDTLALEKNYAQHGVYILHGDADDNVPVEQAREMKQKLATFHHDFMMHEQPGAGHWWDASDEPGADCVDWGPMFDFFGRHERPLEESVRQVDFVTASPGVSAWSRWAGILGQTHPGQISSVSLRCDPGMRRFSGTTENVSRLDLRLSPIRTQDSLTVILDGQKLENIAWPQTEGKAIGKKERGTVTESPMLHLERVEGKWSVTGAPSPAMKSPDRYGPFKQAFRNRMLFVYGTQGNAKENEWAYARARYDAETFWYRGNGSVEVVADTAFDPKKEPERSVILYGNAETNRAWNALLPNSPVQVRRDGVKVGDHTLTGGDLACLFVQPRPGSENALVGVVGGTGLSGMRLTDRLPYFVSGVEYPDCIVFGSEMLARGGDGVRCAGYFGQDWQTASGEFVWKK